ncbi:hypothetical protein PLESTM_000787700 [Pleodorina starrii]|nr:hypothetical protein PLESTM_000787700 [Pleodorina starrii]
MEPDEREPIRGRQARAARARVGRSGPLFTSSSGSSDGEGNVPGIRSVNIAFPPNLLGHYYVRDPTCETSTMMQLPITETQRVPIAVLPSPGSASKRPSSLTPSSVATTRNLDLDLGPASPVGSGRHQLQQQHRYQAQELSSPASSSTLSTTSRISRAPPPPGYVSSSCYQLGCSPQCPVESSSRRRTTSPHAYAAAFSPEPSPRGRNASVPYKYYKQPRNAGLSPPSGTGQCLTPRRERHSPLGDLGAMPACNLSETAEQLSHHQQANRGQHLPGHDGVGLRPWRHQHRSIAPLPPPSEKPESGDVAIKDWAANRSIALIRPRARSDGSGLPSSASGLDRNQPMGPPAVHPQPPAAHEPFCHHHQPGRHGEPPVNTGYADSSKRTAGVTAAMPSGTALSDSSTRAAGARPPMHVSPRATSLAVPLVAQQQHPQLLPQVLHEATLALRSSDKHQQLGSPLLGVQQDLELHLSLLTSPLRVMSDPRRSSAALSELDGIVGGAGDGSCSDHGHGGGGDGVGLTVDSRTGMYDITTILRQDGTIETVLHINSRGSVGGGDQGCHGTGGSLSQSPITTARSGGRQLHHHGGDSNSGAGRSPPLAPSSPLISATSITAVAGGLYSKACGSMSELAAEAGIQMDTAASQCADSVEPGDVGWAQFVNPFAEAMPGVLGPAAGLLREDGGPCNLQQQQPSCREADQAERPPQDWVLFEEETAVATAEQPQQKLQEPDKLGTPKYSYVPNPLFRSYGGASGSPDPNMADIESASPARLTDDGGVAATGTRTPPSSTRRSMVLLGGPPASSSGDGASGRSSYTLDETVAPSVALEGVVLADSLGNSDAEADLFSLPLPSPTSLRQMQANSDGNNSGRLSPTYLLSASEVGEVGGPNAFACSPTRRSRSSTADGMRVLDLTCLQQPQPQCDDDHPAHAVATAAAAEPLAAPRAVDVAPADEPVAVADAPLGELPSLSPCWAGGFPDCAWDPSLTDDVPFSSAEFADTDLQPDYTRTEPADPAAAAGAMPLPSAAFGSGEALHGLFAETAPQMRSLALERAVTGASPLPFAALGAELTRTVVSRRSSGGGSADVSSLAAVSRRSSGGGSSTEREAPVRLPAPVMMAAATEVQLQGADLMAMARRMEQTGDDILTAALEARRRSEDALAAAQEAREKSFTLMAEAVSVKMQGADILTAARIVQLQGADLMVVAAREHEAETEGLQRPSQDGGLEVQDEAAQATAAKWEEEEEAVLPAANPVLEQLLEEPFAVEEDELLCQGDDNSVVPPQANSTSDVPTPPQANSSSDVPPVVTALWPPLGLANASSVLNSAPLPDARPVLPLPPFSAGAGCAVTAVAYIAFPNQLTMDMPQTPYPDNDDFKKTDWALSANARGLGSEGQVLQEQLRPAAGSSEASEQQHGRTWQETLAAAGSSESQDDAQAEEEAQRSQQEAAGVAGPEAQSDAKAKADLATVAAAAAEAAAEPVEVAIDVADAATRASVEVSVGVEASAAAQPVEETITPVAAAAGAAAYVAPAAGEATAAEYPYTQAELDELMELALEYSAEAMGIRAAEQHRAITREEEALDDLAVFRAEIAPCPQPQAAAAVPPPPPVLLYTEAVRGNTFAPASPSGISVGAMMGAQQQQAQQQQRHQEQQRQRQQLELQRKRQQDERQAAAGPTVAGAAGEGNAAAVAAARGTLSAWDLDVGGDGTALLSLQPRQRRLEEIVVSVEERVEELASSPKGAVEASAAIVPAVTQPAASAAAQPPSGRRSAPITPTSTRIAAAAVASTAAVEAAVATAVAAMLANVRWATQPQQQQRLHLSTTADSSASAISGANNRASGGQGAICASPAAAASSPSTGSSTRGKARAKAKAVAVALAATQAKAATAAAVAPSVPAPAPAPLAAAVSATAPMAQPAPASALPAEGAWSTAAPARASRHPFFASPLPGTSGFTDAPAPGMGSDGTAGSGIAGRDASTPASDTFALPQSSHRRALSPVRRSQRTGSAPAQRPQLQDASAIPADGTSSAVGGSPSGAAPAAAARAPIASVGTLRDSLAVRHANAASDEDDDEEEEGVGRGVSWLRFGSGLLASAALVCASALHIAQNPQSQPQAERLYQPRLVAQRPRIGRDSGSSIDSVEGNGVMPLNASTCPAPWLLRCVPVEVDGGGGHRDAAAAAAAAMAPSDQDDGGMDGSFGEAAEPEAGTWDALGGSAGDGREDVVEQEGAAEEEQQQHRVAMASLGAAVALVSHPQYVGSGVPAWLATDPRVVSAELEGQLFEDVAPLLGNGGPGVEWIEGAVEDEASTAGAEAELDEEDDQEEEEEEDQEEVEQDEEEELAEAAEAWAEMEAQGAWEGEGESGALQAAAGEEASEISVHPAQGVSTAEVDEAPAIPVVRRVTDFWPPLGVAVPDAAVADQRSVPAMPSAAAATVAADVAAAVVPTDEQIAPITAGTYLRGAGLALSALVAATASALLWAGRRRRVPLNPWMAEWKSVWDVGPIPSVPRNAPAGAAAPGALPQGSAGADNGVYDAYGAAAVAAGGAAAYAMYGNADSYHGYPAGAAAPSGSVAFGGPAGFPHHQPTEYDGAYYHQQQHHHHQQQQQQHNHHYQGGSLPSSPRRLTRDVPTNTGLLDCYYLRSNRMVPRGSPRTPAQRPAGGSLGGADGGAAAEAFAVGGDPAVPPPPAQMGVWWYHWLRNRTIFCFNQQEMSPEARRLIADQHQQ